MAIRYKIDRETGQPHKLDHGVAEEEVEEVLEATPDDLLGRNRTRIATRQTLAGHTLRVVYAEERTSHGDIETVIVTAYELRGAALAAFRRRRRKRFR